MHSPLSRRAFLKTSVAAAAAATIAPAMPGASVRKSAKGRPAGFEIFVCDWTIQKRSDPEAFPLAKRIGLDGVQVDFGIVKESSSRLPLFDPAHQDRILAASAENGVAISSLAMGVLNSIPYRGDTATEQWVLDSVAVMKRMKAKVTLLAFFGKGTLVDDAGKLDESGIEEVIRRLKKLAPRARDAGVIYGIESWLKVPVLERILDAVKSPAIQVYYDVGNMQKVGESVGPAIRRLGRERICEVHLKDYDGLYGKGSMDFPAVRQALDDAGYRGWVGIEGVVTKPLGVEPSIKYDLDYLRPIFPKQV